MCPNQKPFNWAWLICQSHMWARTRTRAWIHTSGSSWYNFSPLVAGRENDRDTHTRTHTLGQVMTGRSAHDWMSKWHDLLCASIDSSIDEWARQADQPISETGVCFCACPKKWVRPTLCTFSIYLWDNFDLWNIARSYTHLCTYSSNTEIQLHTTGTMVQHHRNSLVSLVTPSKGYSEPIIIVTV